MSYEKISQNIKDTRFADEDSDDDDVDVKRSYVSISMLEPIDQPIDQPIKQNEKINQNVNEAGW